MLQFAVVWQQELLPEGRKTGPCLTHSSPYRERCANGAVPWGRENGKCAWAVSGCVLLWGSEVCIVQRLKWQEFVRMCARKVQWVSSYNLDCELFVGLCSLKVGVLVAVVHCSDGAAASCNVVDTLCLNRGENMEIWKQLILFVWLSMPGCRYVLWCFRGMHCLHLEGDSVVHVWNVMCTVEIGVVVNVTTLSSPPHCWPWMGNSQSHYSRVSTCTFLLVDLKIAVHKLSTHIRPPAITHCPVSVSRSWSVYSTCAHLHVPCFWHLEGPLLKCCPLFQYWPFAFDPSRTVSGQISSSCPI